MCANLTFSAVALVFLTACSLASLGGCASSSRTRPMTQAEGRIRYPIQIAVWPRDINSADERAQMDACWAGTHNPPTRADDQSFLDCMGDAGFRLTIYRQSYILSNVGQPFPRASTPPPPVAVPYAAPVPNQNTTSANSSQFHITWQQAFVDLIDLGKAYNTAKKDCARNPSPRSCMAQSIGKSKDIDADVLNALCTNQDAVRSLMAKHKMSNDIPTFDMAASIACGG